jgi:Mor family transcriptional regulator
MPSTKKSGHEFLAFCAAIIEQQLQAAGLTSRRASETALRVMDEARQFFGGDSIYFPKGRPDADERAAEVHALWQGGATVADIAARFNCTTRWVYSLLGRERARLSSIRAQSKRHASK